MEKVMGLDLMGVIMPLYLCDTKRIKHNQLLINNLKFGLSSRVIRQQSSKLVMVKDIVCTFAFNQSLGNNREVAKVLEIDKRNIKKGVERFMMLDTSQNVFWMDYKKAK
jgi:hypothetical protein